MFLLISSIQKLHDNKKIDLNGLVDLKLLKEKKIISKKYLKLKILGTGDIKIKLNIAANFASKQAQEKIQKIGGTLNILKK